MVGAWVQRQERTEVGQSLHLLQLNFFKVVGVDVVPELAQECVVGAVVGIGLLIGDFEVEPT